MKEQTSQKHLFKRDQTKFSNNNYFVLNSEHNWEDLCIQVRNQQNMHFW